jgi:hypothetical protein
MFRKFIATPSPRLKYWLACLMILVVPGALIVVPAVWLMKVLRKGAHAQPSTQVVSTEPQAVSPQDLKAA